MRQCAPFLTLRISRSNSAQPVPVSLVCEFWLFLSTLATWRTQAKLHIKISADPPAALNADRVKKRPDLKR